LAVLTRCNLSLEIKPFKDYRGNIDLRFYFKYKDKNVFNKDIFAKDNKDCSFVTEEETSLSLLIKKVLDTNQPDYWDSMEPRVVIGIYPNLEFPFLKEHETEKGNYYLFSENNDIQWSNLKSISSKEKGNYDYTIIVCLDSVGLQGEGLSFYQGMSLIIRADRDELEKFVEELEFECKNAKRYDPKTTL